MDANLTFEIKAEAFRRMTGQMAPGKDPGMAGESMSYDERCDLWLEWIGRNAEIISAMLMAVEVMTPNSDIEGKHD